MALSRPPELPDGVPPAPPDASADAWSIQYPALWEYMTAVVWSDGAARLPASISLFSEGGVCKVWLNDKALCRTCCVAAPSFAGALARLDRGLSTEDGLDWRPVRTRPLNGRAK